jgi:hypothetical protein
VSESHSGYFHQFTIDGINLSRTLTRTYFPVIRLVADINQEVKYSIIAALLVQLCYTVVWGNALINVTWVVPSGIKQKCSTRISLLLVITLHLIYLSPYRLYINTGLTFSWWKFKMDKQEWKSTSQLQTHLIHGGKTVVENKTEKAKQWYHEGFQKCWRASNNLKVCHPRCVVNTT